VAQYEAAYEATIKREEDMALRLEQLPAEAETCPRALFASTCQGRRQALVNMTGGIGAGLSGRVAGTPSTPARGPTAAMYTSRHRKDDTPMVCHVSPPIGMRRADRSRFAGEQLVANIRRPTLYYAPANQVCSFISISPRRRFSI
jgi:hypothetical protein